MKAHKLSFTLAATLLLAAVTFTGCESTDGGSTHVSSNVYYEVGFYDPWYYGHYYYDYDVIVTPPEQGARPSHPIALPPEASPRPPAASQRPAAASPQPAARPMPSIPSTPRPMPRPAPRR